MNIRVVRIEKDKDLALLASMAGAIWRECYASILSSEQIEYMLSKFLSADVLSRQMAEDGYEYYFVECDGERVGFVGIKAEEKRLFLSKLYIKEEYRGRGISSVVLGFLEDECRHKSLRAIYLTVNKYNDRAYNVYINKGYKVVDDVVTDIGSGYVMDDYAMQKIIL
jgi:ribosomal protein S18 acetylase RimI-like enzyme